MNLYTQICAGALFPLHEYLKRHNSVAIRRSHEKTQWWNPAQLDALRLKRLKTLLTKVGQHVPYYRNLFQEIAFDPSILCDLNELQKLPFLTKTTIRANTDVLKADNADGLARFNTGGSSGEPLIFFIGRDRVSHDVAAKWRATRWWNVDIGDPETVVWGSPIELGAQDYVRMVRDRLLRTQLLSAFEMSPEKLDSFIAAIRQQRPKMLFGYPSSLSMIAQHAERRGIKMDDLGIQVAFVTSERLYDQQREQISKVFNCRVANGYGSRDAGFIAHECPSGSLHITAEDVIVELVNTDGAPVAPGEAGEIVVTHLATSDFPFIRYRTGDIAVMGTQACTCGRGLPTLREIQGRTTDFVVAADGTVMHGLALVYVVRDLPGVEAFKIVQESLTKTKVLLVSGSAFNADSIQVIQKGLKARLGGTVSIEVELVEDIPAEKSGKYRYIISHVYKG